MPRMYNEFKKPQRTFRRPQIHLQTQMLRPDPIVQIRKIKFSALYKEWLDLHRIEIERSTAYKYEKDYVRMEKYWGDIDLVDMTPDIIQGFINQSLLDLSHATVNKYCQTLKMCFRYAITKGYISETPMDLVIIPRRQRSEIHPFSPEEIKLLLQLPVPNWIRDGIIIAYRTGMRVGEVYGLEWADINFNEQFISVQRSQCRVGSEAFVKLPKTKAGIRRIDIDTTLALHLIEMKERLEFETKYVFPNPNDPQKFLIPWNISTYLRQMCRDAGIPERNFHTLRHTHASVLLAHGTHPKIVQERLGHADVRQTLTTYSHMTPTIQKQAVDVFEDL